MSKIHTKNDIQMESTHSNMIKKGSKDYLLIVNDSKAKSLCGKAESLSHNVSTDINSVLVIVKEEEEPQVLR